MKYADSDMMIIVIKRRRGRVYLLFVAAMVAAALAWPLSFFWPVLFYVQLAALAGAVVQVIRFARLTTKLEELDQ